MFFLSNPVMKTACVKGFVIQLATSLWHKRGAVTRSLIEEMFIKEMVTQRKHLLEKDTGINITFVGEPCFVGVT